MKNSTLRFISISLALCSLLFSKTDFAQTTYSLPSSSCSSCSNGTYAPVDICDAKYTAEACIYPSSSLAFGTISTVAFDQISGSQTSIPVKIYMKSTSSSTLSAGSWTSATSGATLVYSGNVSFTSSGWHTVTLGTNFTYSSNNLEILVECDWGTTVTCANNPILYYYTVSGNADEYWESTANTSSALGSETGTIDKLPMAVQVTVTPACSNPNITTQPSASTQTICQSGSATALSVTATGTTLTYQWYSNTSNSNSGGTSISGATSSSYTPSTSTAGTLYYYCIVESQGGCPVTSSVSGAIVINAPPSISSQSTGTQTICQNATASVMSVTATGTSLTYQWYKNTSSSNSGGTSISGATSSNYTPSTSTAGTLYYYCIVSGASPCSAATSAVSGAIIINAIPSAPTGSTPQVFCSATSATISSLTATGSSILWYAASSGGSSLATSTALTNGTTYYASQTVSGCESTSRLSVSVTINTSPTVSISPSSAAYCIGGSTSLTASGASTYTWAPNTNLSATTGATVTANPTSTKTYTVTGTASNGCTNTQTVVVTVNSLPTVSVSPSAPSICIGSSTSLTASGASTYTWASNTNLTATTGATVTANPSSTITYTVTGTNSNGCVNTQTVVVTVNLLPTISVSPSAPTICYGSSSSLTASGASTYTWSPSTGLSATTGATVTANPTSTKTYTVTGTNANGCVNTASVIVTVDPSFSASASGTNVTCAGSNNGSATATPSGGTSPYTYSWNTSPVQTNATATSLAAGIYIATVTDNVGCTTTASETITQPAAQWTQMNGGTCDMAYALCPDGSNLYVGINYGNCGANNYVLKWNGSAWSNLGYVNGTIYAIAVSGSNIYVGGSFTKAGTTTVNNIAVWNTSSSSWSAMGSGTNGTVNALTINGSTLYAGGQFTTANGTTSNYIASWNTGSSAWSTLTPSGGSAGVSGPVYALTMCNGNLYAGGKFNTANGTTVNNIVEWTGSNWTTLTSGGNTGVSSTTIISPAGVASAAYDAPVMALTSNGTTLYVGGDFNNAGGSSGFNNIASWSTTGSAWSKLSNGGNSGMTVNNGDNANVYALTNFNGNIIAGGDFQDAGGVSVNFTAEWNGSAWSALSTGSGVLNSDVFALTATNGVLYAGGQFAPPPSGVNYVAAYSGAKPVISPSSATICSGNSTTLTASGSSTYSWVPSTGLNTTIGATVTANPTSTTTYTVTGTLSNGCTYQQTVVVTVNPTPTVTITPSLYGICSGSSDSLTASGASTYLWSTSATSNPIVVSPTSTTTYSITGTNSYGCTATASQSLLVSNCQANTCASANIISPTASFSPVDYSFSPGQSNEWFSFTADSANMIIDFTHPFNAADTPVANINVLQLYSGSCGGLSLIASDTVPAIIGLNPSVKASGLTPGQTYTINIKNGNVTGCNSCSLANKYFGVSIYGTHRATGLGTANVPIIQWQYTNIPQYTNASGLLFPNAASTTGGENWFYDIVPLAEGGYIACGYTETNPYYTWEPVAAKFDANGKWLWEQVYQQGETGSNQGYFWRTTESTDASHTILIAGEKVYNPSPSIYNQNVFVVEVSTTDGTVLNGSPYYYYNTSSGIQRSSSFNSSYNTGFGEYQGLRAVYNSGTLDGFIIATNEQGGKAGLLKLDATLNLDASFGNNGYQTYQYNGYPTTPSDVEVIPPTGTFTYNQYALTGWVKPSPTRFNPNPTDEIYLLITDQHGNSPQQFVYPHSTILGMGYDPSKTRYKSDNGISNTASNVDWGMNIMWVPSYSILVINAACDFQQVYSGYGGTFYSQINPTGLHADSYQTFSDALLLVDYYGDLEAIANVGPFDGIDFTPRIVYTPSDNGIAVSGNLSYASPDFPSPTQSVGGSGNPHNTLSPTLFGVNVDIVKLDQNLNVIWNQQYRAWAGHNSSTPPNAAVECNWGFAVTSDGGFILSGNNELNDEDYAILKLYPPTGTTAVSQINESTIDPLLDIQITPAMSPYHLTGNIEGVVDVEPGATVIVDNLSTTYFADKLETGLDSKIVVEQGGSIVNPSNPNGGKLQIFGTVTAIPGNVNGGTMWQGIEVGGDVTKIPPAAVQGKVTITGPGGTNTIPQISNAINGVTTARFNAEYIPDLTTSGSSVVSSNSALFQNNWRSIQIMPRGTYGGNSNLANSQFLQNAAIGHHLLPYYSVSITGNSATINNNKFLVDNTYWGTLNASNALASGISLNNSNLSPTNNTFTDLYTAIYQTTSIPTINVTISANTFTNDYTSVTLSGSSYSSVNSNTFVINKALHQPSSPAPLGWSPSGIVLNNCHHYSVQDNSLTSTSAIWAYGIVVTNSNYGSFTENEVVNNNTLSNYTPFQTYYLIGNKYRAGGVAIQPQGDNQYLQVRCNTNSTNNIDISAMPQIGYPTFPVANQQGTCLSCITYPTLCESAPAGNIFSYPSTSTCSGDFDIYSSSYSFTYTHHTNSATTPGASCYNSPVTPTSCAGVTYTNWSTDACPDQLVSCCGGGHYSCCISNHSALKLKHDSMQSVIDSGNATRLFSILHTGTPAQIQDSLLAHSPYLSDSLLLATIHDSLPADTLRNILIPNSPLTGQVIQAALALSLPGTVREQIEAAQDGGPSGRRQLEHAIGYYAFQEDISANGLIRSYLADTTINGQDSALVFLATIPGVESMSEQADINISMGQYSAASSLVSEIQTTGLMNDFCSLSNVLIQLGNSGKTVYQMDSVQIDTVTNIAYRTIQAQSTKNAQAILMQVYGLSFHDTILPILDSGSGHRAIISQNNQQNGSNENVIAQGNVKLYPNPANNRLTIEYNLNNNSMSTLVVYDLLGNKIQSYDLPTSQTIITEDISNLSAGFYVYCVETSDKIAQRGKFIVAR